MKSRDGFALIDLGIALALMGVLAVKLTMIVDQAAKAHRDGNAEMILEDQAQHVLDKIVYALAGADPDSLDPNAQTPFFSSKIAFRVSLGVENDQVVWGAPEVIGLAADPSQLYWARNEGALNAQSVVWTRAVAELLERELLNGTDDNVNGLTDESGLAFDVAGDSVTIRLTLVKETQDGCTITKTKETVVTCRN
jgi:hypothetical protein